MASSNCGDEMTDKRDVKSKIAMFKCLEKPTVPPKPVKPRPKKYSLTKTEPNIEGTLSRPSEDSIKTTNSEGKEDHKVPASGHNEPDVLPTVDTGNQASDATRHDDSQKPVVQPELWKEQKRLQATLNRELIEKTKETFPKSESEGNEDHKVPASGHNEPDVLPTVDTGNQASHATRHDDSQKPVVQSELSEESKRLQAKLNRELIEKAKETLPKSDREWSPNEMEVFKRPMCLISTDDSENTLKIEKETLAQISRIDWPLCVVSVAGLYRTGKSFLMNRLAGKTEGFALGDTIESKTKGIWVWCRIHPNVEKKNTVLVLLDTEGLGDIEKGDPNHDNKIFTIAVLLCNTLVYNMKGAFDQDAVAKLTFVTEMSQNIRFGDKNSNDNDQLKLVLPSFVLCLRDFSLKLYKSNKGTITEDEYLEYSLQSSEKKGDSFNKPRECIRRFFPNRKCFAFPVPGDADILENLENLEFDALSPRFKTATERFVEYIYLQDAKELLVSKPINGAMFATLADNYINALADGAIPDVDDAFTAVAKLENARVQTAALELFKKKMESIDLPVPSSKLESLYTDAQNVALDYFRDNAVHDFIDRSSEKETEMVMKSTWNDVSTKNLKLTRSKCQETLQSKSEELRKNIQTEKYYVAGGYSKFKGDLEKVRQNYMSDYDVKRYDEHEVLMSWMTFQQHIAETENKILQKDTEISEEEKESQRLQSEKKIKEMQQQHQNQLEAKLAEQKRAQESREAENERKREKQFEAEREKFYALERKMMAEKKEIQSKLESMTKEKNEIQTQVTKLQQKVEAERQSAIAKEKEAEEVASQLTERVTDLEAIKNLNAFGRFKAVFTGFKSKKKK